MQTTYKYELAAALMLLATFIASIFFLSYGWSGLINDYYGFRQAQTAISVFYLVHEQMQLDYITPVLGYPWSIPFEFPSYQFSVAALVKLTGLPIDQAGRLVSLSCYYLCVFPIYSIFRQADLDREKVLIVLILFLSSPFYLFWSRTFMIESMALLWSLILINMVVLYLKKESLKYLLFGLIFGLLAALTKITTFIVAVFFATSLIFYLWGGREDKFSFEVLRRYIALGFITMGIPLGISILWNIHADSLKSLNPLAQFILSKNLRDWNFGTIEQRFSLDVLDHLLWRFSNVIGYSWNFNTFTVRVVEDNWGLLRKSLFLAHLFCVIVPLIIVIATKKYRVIAIGLIAAFLIGPLLFINLYFEHEYYFYACGVYLLCVMALGLIIVTERRPLVGFVMLAVILVARADAYIVQYVAFIDHSQSYNDIELYTAIKENVSSNDYIIGIGDTWSSVIPYYSERKAIMINSEQIKYASFAKSVISVGKNNIAAIVVCEDWSNTDKKKLAELVGNFSNAPIYKGSRCSLFLMSNINKNIMSNLMAASNAPPEHLSLISKTKLFSHAPSVTNLCAKNVSSFSLGYGINDDAMSKTAGACFNVSFIQGNAINKVLLEDCIVGGDVSEDNYRTFVGDFDDPLTGCLVFSNSCIEPACGWAWTYWDNLKVTQTVGSDSETVR